MLEVAYYAAAFVVALGAAMSLLLPPLLQIHAVAQAASVYLACVGRYASRHVAVTWIGLAFVAASCSTVMVQHVDCADGTISRDGRVVDAVYADTPTRDTCDTKASAVLHGLSALTALILVAMLVLLAQKATVKLAAVEQRALNPLWIVFEPTKARNDVIDPSGFTLMLITALAVRTSVSIGVTPLPSTTLFLAAAVGMWHSGLYGTACAPFAAGIAAAKTLWMPTCADLFVEMEASHEARCADERLLLRALHGVLALTLSAGVWRALKRLARRAK